MSRTNSTSLHRRDFLRASAAAAAVWSIVPRHVLGGPKFVTPSDKVNVAVVGVGGQGRSNIRELFQESDAQIIAIADPIAESNLDAFYYRGKSTMAFKRIGVSERDSKLPPEALDRAARRLEQLFGDKVLHR